MCSFEDVKAAVDFIRSKCTLQPRIGIICGSSLGGLADSISDSVVIPYSEIKHFPRSTVKRHAGRLVLGKLAGKTVACMQGRCHPYEGYSMKQLVLPIRVLKSLGVEKLILTNAAGGLDPRYKLGDIMIIKDHINLLALTGLNPLVGPNDERFGPRFPRMIDVYNKELRELAKTIGAEMRISDILHEGIYVAQMGPSFETGAERQMYRWIGGQAVGMSTAHEAIVAAHAGMRIFGLSLITATAEVINAIGRTFTPEEVLTAREKASAVIQAFLIKFIQRL